MRLFLFSFLALWLHRCEPKRTDPPGPISISNPHPASYEMIQDSIVDIQLPTATDQSYTMYAPSQRYTKKQPSLVILFLDPHGAGRVPVEKYMALADHSGIALVGSNNSQNGQDIYTSMGYANNIINDLVSRMHFVKNDICIAGFSGGAKVALQTAAGNPGITKAIYSGAATPVNASHPLHLLGFAGVQDMNYTDLLAFSESYKDGLLVEFNGKHDWPDTVAFRKAFYWLNFQSLNQDSAKLRDAISEFITMEQKQITKDHALRSYQTYEELIYILEGVADVSPYRAQRDLLYKDPVLQAALKEKKELQQKEVAEKQMLMTALQKENDKWWLNTINRYKASPAASDKRLLGFISLGCYSYSSQLIARGDTAGAAHFLTIYELADPDNTDQLYMHAVLYGMRNNPALGISYLRRAVNKGFKDWQKIVAEPCFTQWRGDERFSRLLTSLKSGPR